MLCKCVCTLYKHTILFECPVIYVCRFTFIDFMSNRYVYDWASERSLVSNRLMNFRATQNWQHIHVLRMIDDWYNGAFYVHVKRLGLWIFCTSCHRISMFTLRFGIHFFCVFIYFYFFFYFQFIATATSNMFAILLF